MYGLAALHVCISSEVECSVETVQNIDRKSTIQTATVVGTFLYILYVVCVADDVPDCNFTDSKEQKSEMLRNAACVSDMIYHQNTVPQSPIVVNV